MDDMGMQEKVVYDGRRMRKPVVRKTVDYNSPLVHFLEGRPLRRDWRERPYIAPSMDAIRDMEPAMAYLNQPANGFTSKYVHTSMNKTRRPIHAACWTPEGRRLLTGSQSGEFTLWNGQQFNFETILQAHTSPIRAMRWSHNDEWMLSADDSGIIKYWQITMNNVKAFPGHTDPIRGVAFSPSNSKFLTCSDDRLIKIWDFATCTAEAELRGHGWDVKSADWHPQKALLVSGGKDNVIKMWCPKSGTCIKTIFQHKNTVNRVSWNANGNWFVSASRDQMVKIWDMRNTTEPMRVYKDHTGDVTSVAWHPVFESMLVTGDGEGSIRFWIVGEEECQGEIMGAHNESVVQELAWHPMGHILVSASNDQSTRFWTRNYPGDEMRDKYNAMQLPAETRKEAIVSLIEAARNQSMPGRGANLPAKIMQYNVRLDDDSGSRKSEHIPGLCNAERLSQCRSSVRRRSRSRDTKRPASPGIHPDRLRRVRH